MPFQVPQRSLDFREENCVPVLHVYYYFLQQIYTNIDQSVLFYFSWKSVCSCPEFFQVFCLLKQNTQEESK